MPGFAIAKRLAEGISVVVEDGFAAAAQIALAMSLSGSSRHGPTEKGAPAVGVAAIDELGCELSRRVGSSLASMLAGRASLGQVLICEKCQAEFCANPLPAFSTAPLGRMVLSEDLSSIQVFQLGDEDGPQPFPPLPGIELLRDNLGRRALPFFGRQSDIERVFELLLAGRATTIVGDPGIGKSSLAWRVGLEVRRDFPSGIWRLPVPSASNCDALTHDLANVVKCGLDRPTQPAIDLRMEFSDGRSLVIIDDCDCSMEGASQLAESLLRNYPTVTLLLTSRLPLGLSDECIYRLGPMKVPPSFNLTEGESGADSDALDLLLDRVERLTGGPCPDENLPDVVEICRLTGGYPLDLLLAGFEVASMGSSQVRAEMRAQHRKDDHANQRSQTPKPSRSITQVYDSLSAEARSAARELTILSSGWGLSAAASIAFKGDSNQALRVLGELSAAGVIDGHFLPDGSLRYSISSHSLDFLVDILSHGERTEADQRRVSHYLQFVMENSHLLKGSRLAEALRAIDSEYGNILSVVGLCLAKSSPEAVCFVANLAPYWQRMRPLSEWQDISAASVEIARHVRGPDSARALNVASTGQFCAGEYEEARELAELARLLAQQCGDTVAEAMSMANLSLIEKEQGKLLASSRFCSDAIDILRALDEPRRLAACLTNLGGTREGLGQLDQALECYYQAADVARQIKDPWTETRALVNVAELKLFNGDVTTARTLFLDSLKASACNGDIATIAFSAEGLSMSLGACRAHLAAIVLGFARSQRDMFDLEPTQNWRAKLEDHRSDLIEVIGSERLIAIEATGAELSVNDIAEAVGAEI